MYSSSSSAKGNSVAGVDHANSPARHSTTTGATSTSTATQDPKTPVRSHRKIIDKNSQSLKAVRKQLEYTTPKKPTAPKKAVPDITLEDLPPLPPQPPATPRTQAFEDYIDWGMAASSPLASASVAATNSSGTTTTANNTSQASQVTPPVQPIFHSLGNTISIAGPSHATQASNKVTDAKAPSITGLGKENVEDGDVGSQGSGPAPVTPTAKGSYKQSNLKSARKRTRSTTSEGEVETKRVRFDDDTESGAQPSDAANGSSSAATPPHDALEAQTDSTNTKLDTLPEPSDEGASDPKDKGKARATYTDEEDDVSPPPPEVIAASRNKGKARATDDDLDHTDTHALPALIWNNQPSTTTSQSLTHSSGAVPLGAHLVHPAVPHSSSATQYIPPRPYAVDCDASFIAKQLSNHVPKTRKTKKVPYEILVDLSSQVAGPSTHHQTGPAYNGLVAFHTTPMAILAPSTVPAASTQPAPPTAQTQTGASTSGSATNSNKTEDDVAKGTARCGHGTFVYPFYEAPRTCFSTFPATLNAVEAHLLVHNLPVTGGGAPKLQCPWVGCNTLAMAAKDLTYHVFAKHVKSGAAKKLCSRTTCVNIFRATKLQNKCEACR